MWLNLSVVCLHWTNLEIKVGYFPGVEVVDPLEDLLDELSGLFLAQRLLLCQEVKELTSRDPATQTRIIQLPAVTNSVQSNTIKIIFLEAI